MVRTVVCKKEGCSGNEFIIETTEGKFKATCKECSTEFEMDLNDTGYELLSVCSTCKNGTFKVFRDYDKSKIYAKCTECGNPPEKVFVDIDGIQISYNEKLLEDIKSVVSSVEQRMCNLEIKIEDMERGQAILEESLAYINKYIIEDR
ncbi:MAG: hypothetical protein ACRC1T_10255 [Clostridium chrysemydis]|uniref:hypothetical protein n=1 Tax=Clostridium chrysemydis TaxID=2665504 RepID=UPI003F356AB7